MKKINTAIYIALLTLSVFTCKRQVGMKEYIERGFAKPTLKQDAHFSKEKTADNGKIYVPSKEEIEVQFTIKNKYNQELTGKIEVPQSKKVLFEKEPEIKELTPTKMVIAFNFNQEAEPKEKNEFLGESVGMTVRIFEKKTGRFLSSQTITANCNTAPPFIKIEDIVYKAETDEYLVTLPKGEGVHQDLKEVHFILSSAYGNEKVEPKIMSVIDAGEQGKKCTLKIKGDEGWQLKHPSGQRNIKAIVYDRAGLKSDENDQEKSKTKRFFTSITLLPSNKDISLKKAKEIGVPIPKIVELEEFFNGDNWQNESGYSVEYSNSTPLGFSYDSEQKVFKNPNAQAGVTYKIKVTLKQGALYNTPVEKDFSIKVVGDNVAAIDQDSLIITDITKYPEGKPLLQFDSSTFNFSTDNDGVKAATVGVPYTSFDTWLSVKVRAISEECKGQDKDSSTYWSPEQYKTEYIRKIGNEPDNKGSDIEFTITSPDGIVKQKYRISLVREDSPTVKVEFDKGLLPIGSVAKAKMTWKYAKEEFSFTVGGVQNKEITVGKNEYIDFNISVGDGVIIKECRSSFGPHQLEASGGNIRIQAVSSFTLTIKLKPESTIKWENYLIPANECGYTKGKITYGEGASETSYTPSTPDLGHAVIKGSPITCKIEGLNAETHFVEKWIVNNKDVTKSEDKFGLDKGKTELKILSAKGDYVVEVVVKKKMVELEIEFDKSGHNYELRAYDASQPLPVESGSSVDKYKYKVRTDAKVKLNVSKKAGLKIPYGIEKWSDVTGGISSKIFENVYEVEVTVEKNKKLKIALLPQYTFTLSPKSSGCSGVLRIANSATETQVLESLSMQDGPKTKTILTRESELYFKVTGLGTDNLVVGYRKKANDNTNFDMTDLFDDATGFWKVDNKGKNLKLNIKAGDEFEVVLDRVKYIKVSVREFEDSSNLYKGSDFTLTITKESSDQNHMLFPRKPGGQEIAITKESFSSSKKVFDIYITHGTKIKFSMAGLEDNNKEIGAWKKGGVDLIDNNLNDLDEESKVLIGRNPASYEFNDNDNYNTLELNACIREITVSLTLEIKCYNEDPSSLNNLRGVEIRAFYKDEASAFLIADKNQATRKIRIKKGKNIKLEAMEKSDGYPKYHFAMWNIKAFGGALDGKNRYPLNIEYISMDRNYEIIGYYTKRIIIVMHKIRDEDKNSTNFPQDPWGNNFTQSFGTTKLTTHKANDDVTDTYSRSNNIENVTQLSTINVSDINNDKVKKIKLELFPGIGDIKHAHWRYSFGGDGINPQGDTTSSTGVGAPSVDGKIATFGEGTTFPIFGVFHLWLYKAYK